MSYDLYFDSNAKLNGRKLRKHLAELPNFHIKKSWSSFQAWYENEKTGVYFSLEYDKNAKPETKDDLEYSGLTFNINFVRPAIFAHEAFTILEPIARSFDLTVFDPQDSEDVEFLAFDKQNLIQSWIKSNEWATKSVLQNPDADGLEFLKVPSEKFYSNWLYTFTTPEIQDSLGDEYFVATPLLLTDGKKLVCMLTWTESIPQVFPEFDSIVFIAELDGGMDDRGIMDYETFQKEFKDYLEPFVYDGMKLQRISVQSAAAAREKFDSVKLMPIPKDLSRAEIDRVIDY